MAKEKALMQRQETELGRSVRPVAGQDRALWQRVAGNVPALKGWFEKLEGEKAAEEVRRLTQQGLFLAGEIVAARRLIIMPEIEPVYGDSAGFIREQRDHELRCAVIGNSGQQILVSTEDFLGQQEADYVEVPPEARLMSVDSPAIGGMALHRTICSHGFRLHFEDEPKRAGQSSVSLRGEKDLKFQSISGYLGDEFRLFETSVLVGREAITTEGDHILEVDAYYRADTQKGVYPEGYYPGDHLGIIWVYIKDIHDEKPELVAMGSSEQATDYKGCERFFREEFLDKRGVRKPLFGDSNYQVAVQRTGGNVEITVTKQQEDGERKAITKDPFVVEINPHGLTAYVLHSVQENLDQMEEGFRRSQGQRMGGREKAVPQLTG